MGNSHAELRRALSSLNALMHTARDSLAAGGQLDQVDCDELRVVICEIDRLLLLGAHTRGAAKAAAEALALLERCDPLAQLRSVKLDYIDRLTATCDSLMRAGTMPDSEYFSALAAAVCDFETQHSGGESAMQLAFAWDILAQAEAGLGEATEESHYAQAEQRYRPQRPTAPVLALVGGTAL